MKRLLKGSWILRSRIWNSHCLPDCDQPMNPPPRLHSPQRTKHFDCRQVHSFKPERRDGHVIHICNKQAFSQGGACRLSVKNIFPSELVLSGGCHELNRLTKSRCYFSLLKAPVGCSSLQLPSPAYYCCCGINISFEKNHR